MIRGLRQLSQMRRLDVGVPRDRPATPDSGGRI